ncbi:MAG: YraN family protein [Bacteroidales bacterium]|nr:YraN family protein [Bacteroidales bacterium]MDD3431906.1 YraN family protein [Bacteroidales bacterium]MDD4362334.1 YraN family protein [Bacteroidales bacterium]MDD4430974.1 YraN family protein [Bacteroidales bacterium]
MALHNELGKSGEAAAQDFLRQKGYQLLDCNWHSGHKELDIVALFENNLIVAEVKTRSDSQYEEPWQAVDNKKIRRIVQAAHHYIKMHQIDLPVRFDILSLLRLGELWEIEHFEDAFRAPMQAF